MFVVVEKKGNCVWYFANDKPIVSSEGNTLVSATPVSHFLESEIILALMEVHGNGLEYSKAVNTALFSIDKKSTPFLSECLAWVASKAEGWEFYGESDCNELDAIIARHFPSMGIMLGWV